MLKFDCYVVDTESAQLCSFRAIHLSGCMLIAVCFLMLAGCGDSRSRRNSVAAELRGLAEDFRANPANLTPLNSIIDVLEHGKYSFDRVYACGELERLGSIAKPAVPALVRALDCGDLYVEREAPLALGAIGEEAREAIPALMANLRKTDRDAGWFSADALGEIGRPALVAIPDLEIAAASDDQLMAESARDALARLKALKAEESQ